MAGSETGGSNNATKLCHLMKRPDFDGYGFNLHSEKVKPGQFIGKIDANSPASAAGLKEGDRIVEVNGVAIGSETHKQVVQRIKAIANEVRLLLIDVDGSTGNDKMATPSTVATTNQRNHNNNNNNNNNANNNNNINSNNMNNMNNNNSNNMNNNNNNMTATTPTKDESYHGSVQEIPGASANISSISMMSVKRSSSSQMSGGRAELVPVPPPVIGVDVGGGVGVGGGGVGGGVGVDMTDRGHPSAISDTSNGGIGAVAAAAAAGVVQHKQQQQQHNNNNNNSNSNGKSNNMTMASSGLPSSGQAAATAAAMDIGTTTATATATTTNNNGNRAGSLQLPMTAAEMRAKLMSRKKFDPKNEGVDLKKKFDIIQKL